MHWAQVVPNATPFAACKVIIGSDQEVLALQKVIVLMALQGREIASVDYGGR